ncbi:MAG: carboxypeptidase-like regulatory domain-containing protein [Bacteroidota bacterium]
MTTIVKNYPIFEPNQVLTHTQLNNLATYLDQQNRLTRVKLIGMGIVCGLELVCDVEAETLQITKGVGVTSEGFLVTVGDDCILTRYRPYTRPDSIEYPPFDQAGDLELFELLTDQAEVDAADEVQAINKDFLDDKVILLYVECFDNDLKSCLGKSCDQLGVDRILNVRKLAVSREAAFRIQSTTASEDLVDKTYNLPTISLPRVIFDPRRDHSFFYRDFSEHYRNALGGTFSQILTLAPQTYWDCLPLLGDLYADNPFEHPVLVQQQVRLKAYLEGAEQDGIPYLGIQNFYDFIQDLLKTYHEFRAVICDLFAVCCPDMGAFPKHLFLGVANPNSDFSYDNYGNDFRQEFLQAPIYNQYRSELERARSLHQRLVLQLEMFELNSFEFGDKQAITPSCEKKGPLGQRSIPFYYQLDRSSQIVEGKNLESVWNYESCREYDFYGQANGDLSVLSYERNTMEDQPIGPQAAPLMYDLDPYDFYRIEGHLGKDIREALARVDKYRDIYNLDFEVKPLYLGDTTDPRFRVQLAACLCRDLQPNYAIWRHKLLFFLNNIVRFTYRSQDLVLNASAYAVAIQKPFQDAPESADTNPNDPTGGKLKSIVRSMTSPRMSSKASGIEAAASGTEEAAFEVALRLINYLDDLDDIGTRSKNSRSSRFVSSSTNDDLDLIGQLNDCLARLIAATNEDIKQMTDLSPWLAAYKCILQVNIDNMKLRADKSSIFTNALVAWITNYILCLIHRILQAVAIHPYINIRLLVDTLNTRIERAVQMQQFAVKKRLHPGLEHQAGVVPGGTFFLLYQLPHEFDAPEDTGSPAAAGDFTLDAEQPALDQQREMLEEMMRDLSKLKKMTATTGNKEQPPTSTSGTMEAVETERQAAVEVIARLEGQIRRLRVSPETTPEEQAEINRLAELLDGRVIGDFSLPYICCDDCADLPPDVVSLDPLASPQCGVVTFRRRPDLPETDPNGEPINPQFPEDYEYVDLEMQVLNNLYDPSIYEVRITADPKLGSASFYNAPYEPNPLLNKQMLRYTVDPTAVKIESQIVNRLLLVDEMGYEIYDRARDEVVDASTISIFILVIDIEEQRMVTIGGEVYTLENNERSPMIGVQVLIEELNLGAVTDLDGRYRFENVPVGEQAITVSPPVGYLPPAAVIRTFTANATNIDFQLFPFLNVIPDIFFERLGLERVSEEGQIVDIFYQNNFETYRADTIKLVGTGQGPDPILQSTSDTVNIITTDFSLTASDLNAEFSRERDILVENLNGDKGRISEQKAGLKALTLAYLDRAALLHSSTNRAGINDTLKETGVAYNNSSRVKFKTTVSAWRTERKQKATTDYLQDVDDHLILK